MKALENRELGAVQEAEEQEDENGIGKAPRQGALFFLESLRRL